MIHISKRKNSKPTLTTSPEESILLIISLKCIEEEFQDSVKFHFNLNSERLYSYKLQNKHFHNTRKWQVFSKICVFEGVIKCTVLALLSVVV